MARIFVVDIGTWSVKIAIASPGLRGPTLTQLVEQQIPPGDGPVETRAIGVAAQLVNHNQLTHDTPYFAVAGDRVFTNILDTEFIGMKRADLDKAIGAELEGVVPLDLEEMVYCYDPLPMLADAGLSGGAGSGRVAAPTNGLRLLTYAMSRQHALGLIERGKIVGAEPRGLLPIGPGAARLVERLPSLAEVRDQAVAVVDIGHERTNVMVVKGNKTLYTRSLSRGGKHVTDAVASHWQMAFQDAERAKHAEGFVASAYEPATSEAADRIHQVTEPVVAALARDLRQSIASARAVVGVSVTHIVVVGGGARLRGLASYLQEKLALRVTRPTADDGAGLASKPDGLVGLDAAAIAAGLALDAASGRPTMDLRSGALAAKVDLSFLKKKAPALAAGLVVVLACGMGAAYADWYQLQKAEKTLTLRLAQESAAYYPDGKSKTAKEVLATAAPGAELVNEAASPLPKWTAYDLLVEISAKVPGKDKVTVDFSRIDVTRDKVEFEGTAKTAEEIKAIVDAFAQIKCLKDLNRGPTDAGPNDTKKFRFSFNSDCM